MKAFSTLILILISVTSCYESERSCSKHKTGMYRSETVIDGKRYTSTFTRTHTIQVETYESHVDSAEVRWINDCEVIFKTIRPKNMAERKDIHLKILTTTDSSYTFEYSYVGKVIKQKGIAYKIKI